MICHWWWGIFVVLYDGNSHVFFSISSSSPFCVFQSRQRVDRRKGRKHQICVEGGGRSRVENGWVERDKALEHLKASQASCRPPFRDDSTTTAIGWKGSIKESVRLVLHRRALQLRPVGRERRKKRRRREETSLDAISVVVDMVVIVARQLMIDSYSSSDVIPKEKRGKTSVPDDGLLGFLLIVLKSLCDLDKLYDDDEARFCFFFWTVSLAHWHLCVCVCDFGLMMRDQSGRRWDRAVTTKRPLPFFFLSGRERATGRVMRIIQYTQRERETAVPSMVKQVSTLLIRPSSSSVFLLLLLLLLPGPKCCFRFSFISRLVDILPPGGTDGRTSLHICNGNGGLGAGETGRFQFAWREKKERMAEGWCYWFLHQVDID